MSAGASLRPSDAATGGFLDGVNALIVSARFVDAYPTGTPAALLEITYQPDGGKAPRTELYSAGKIENMRPTADGKRLTPPEARMRRDSNAMRWITSIIEGGFDASKIADDITVFVGAKVYLRSDTLAGYKQKDGTMTKDRAIVLVSKVLAMPGEGKAAIAPKPKAVVAKPKLDPTAAVTKAAPPAQEVAAGDDEAIAEGIVLELLVAAPGQTIARNRIGSQAFKAVLKAKNPRLMPLLTKEEFLAGADRPWKFDGESLSLDVEEAA